MVIKLSKKKKTANCVYTEPTFYFFIYFGNRFNPFAKKNTKDRELWKTAVGPIVVNTVSKSNRGSEIVESIDIDKNSIK